MNVYILAKTVDKDIDKLFTNEKYFVIPDGKSYITAPSKGMKKKLLLNGRLNCSVPRNKFMKSSENLCRLDKDQEKAVENTY